MPLVEVVRDTVGRHDTFALACNAKYYEDMGYPGHLNCTDNFNAQIQPYAIAAVARLARAEPVLQHGVSRRTTSWSADEPWSRPGDYVLMRAMTDLVCASSACPDDIDPANAWDPTDVHVRVYGAEHASRRRSRVASHPDPRPSLTKRTGFQPRWEPLTRNVAEYSGYWLPTHFNGEGAIAEYWACREQAAVMDLSPLRKFEVLGPDAEALMQATITRDARRLSTGQVVYTAICNDQGGLVDECTVFRLGQDNFRFVAGHDGVGIWLKEQAERLGLTSAHVKASIDQLHNIAVQGPNSRQILERFIWAARPNRRSANSGGSDSWWAGSSTRRACRSWCPGPATPGSWATRSSVTRTMPPPSGMPCGKPDSTWASRRWAWTRWTSCASNPGSIAVGNEYDDQIDPFEAGIGFTVDLRGDEDFVGRAALRNARAHPQRALVGLRLDGNEAGEHGDPVYVGRQQVGVVTSGTRSPVLKETIALARVAVQHTELGTTLEVGKLDGMQKRIAAEVVRFPFYDPDKARPRS